MSSISKRNSNAKSTIRSSPRFRLDSDESPRAAEDVPTLGENASGSIPSPPGQPRIVIIGSGMSGMLMAMRLRQSGFTNFELCEKRGDFGGVWRDNRYPGLRCDIPAHLFTYRGESNPAYTQRFARGAEVYDYLRNTAEKHRLRQNTRFNTSITAAHFSQGRWFLTTNSGEIMIADIVVWAGGILHQEKLPDIAGRETFAGNAFHSSRWNADVSLRGKRVGLIGTGSTAAQIVPAIANQVEHLEVFQRTPHWILPLPNRHYSARSRTRLENHPWLPKAIRWSYEKLMQQTFSRATMGNRAMQRLIRWQCERYLRCKVADPELRERLTPNFTIGCKRLILAKGYFEALQLPNVNLCNESIDHINASGITTTGGNRHRFDTLVYATGFHAHRYMRPMEIVGRDGNTIDDLWQDSTFAHRSVTLPGFPNFFMIIGPQSPTGNQSSIAIAETQVEYLMQLVETVASGKCDHVDPKIEITQRLNTEIQAGMKGTAWRSGCNSWYIDERGNTSMWPWSMDKFRSTMKRVDLNEYRLTRRNVESDVSTASEVHLDRLPVPSRLPVRNKC